MGSQYGVKTRHGMRQPTGNCARGTAEGHTFQVDAG